MKTIALANDFCTLTVTPESGGRITNLVSRRSGIEHVGASQLQTWVKTGTSHDPAVGVLHQFLGEFRGATLDVLDEPGSAGSAGNSAVPRGASPAANLETPGGQCHLSARRGSLTLTKQFALLPDQPVVTMAFSIENHGEGPVRAQFENFFNWSFGTLGPRRGVVTVLCDPAPVARHDVTPYGTMGGWAMPAGAGQRLALCDLEIQESLVLGGVPGRNDDWTNFAILDLNGTCWRGPYSQEFTVAPGGRCEAVLRLELWHGLPLTNVTTAAGAVGVLPDRALMFSDQALHVGVGFAPAPAGAGRLPFTLSAPGVAPQSGTLEAPGGTMSTGVALVTLPAGNLAPGEVTINVEAGGTTAATKVRVLDAAQPPGALIQPAPRPDFPIRAVHLICSQQGVEGLTIDAMKWLIENVVAPCGYTHVIWEFNKAARLRSHSELAEPGSYDIDDIAALARFTRACGLEPVPQQNTFGHQWETNLLRYYPELREVGWDTTVYCPSHPRARQIVGEIVAELVDAFEAKLFHMGHDEVQFKGGEQKVGVCPRCRLRKPAEVFADDVTQVHDVAKAHGARSILWGDHLIPPDLDSGNVNGQLGEVYRAVDMVPKDLIVADWHYYPTENYKSTDFFRARGFEVWAGLWFLPAGIRAFAGHARGAGATGLIATTWARPDLTSLPIEGILYTAQCGQRVESVDGADVAGRVTTHAHALWRRWRAWCESR